MIDWLNAEATGLVDAINKEETGLKAMLAEKNAKLAGQTGNVAQEVE